MEIQKKISWNLKGRSAVAALDPKTRHRVMQSHTMSLCLHKPLLSIIESLITVPYIGGLSGPLHKPELFICYITRLLQITPDPSIILAMLHQDIHKYLRVAALFVIRFIGNEAMVREAIRVGWDDYRKIRVYGSSVDWSSPNNNNNNDSVFVEDDVVHASTYAIMCVDEITDRLFNIFEKDNNNNNNNTDGGNYNLCWLGIQFSPLIFLG